MSTFTIPNVFIANTKIKSASMNANFAAITGVLNTNLLPAVGNASALVTTSSGGNLQSVLPLGAEGQTLVVDPTATMTGGLKWATPSTGTFGGEIYNLGLAMSASAGALTINLKQGDGVTDPAAGTGTVRVAMRNPTAGVGGYNERQIVTPLSITLSSGTTLGMIGSQNNSLWVYLVDSDGAGTMQLAASTIKLDDSRLANVIPESWPATIAIGAGTVTTASTPHGLSPRDTIVYTTTGSLPSPLVATQPYWVDTSSLTTTSFDPSLGPETGTITSTGVQTGTQTVHIANTRLVSNALYSGVAIRLIGRAIFNLATPGTWLVPNEIALQGSIEYEEGISAAYFGWNGDNINNSSAANFSSYQRIYDTHGVLNGIAAGGVTRFVCPIAGLYKIDYAYIAGIQTMSSAHENILAISVKNGLSVSSPSLFINETTGSIFIHDVGSTTIQAEAGDYLEMTLTGSALDSSFPASNSDQTLITFTLVGQSVL